MDAIRTGGHGDSLGPNVDSVSHWHEKLACRCGDSLGRIVELDLDR